MRPTPCRRPATGSAAAIAAPVKRAYATIAAILTDMSTTARAAANDYEATDEGFATLLDRYRTGAA